MKLQLATGEEVLLDEEDYERICDFMKNDKADPAKWQATYCTTDAEPKVYASKTIGGRKGKKWRMHRLIFYLRGIDIEGKEIDHQNTEATLDNRWANLRIATSGQNKTSRGVRRDNKLGYKCVEKNPHGDKYTAYIVIDKKKRSLGSYDTPEEAALAYNRAAIERWGEYAQLNVIKKPRGSK